MASFQADRLEEAVTISNLLLYYMNTVHASLLNEFQYVKEETRRFYVDNIF